MLTVNDASQILTKKLVAVLSEKLEAGTAMNALAHMALYGWIDVGPGNHIRGMPFRHLCPTCAAKWKGEVTCEPKQRLTP